MPRKSIKVTEHMTSAVSFRLVSEIQCAKWIKRPSRVHRLGTINQLLTSWFWLCPLLLPLLLASQYHLCKWVLQAGELIMSRQKRRCWLLDHDTVMMTGRVDPNRSLRTQMITPLHWFNSIKYTRIVNAVIQSDNRSSILSPINTSENWPVKTSL